MKLTNESTGSFSIPSSPGCYVLVLFLPQTQSVRVGRLGALTLKGGYYLYVGSAFGRGGLAGRLRHHLQGAKLHWHIDYLRAVAQVAEVWWKEEQQRRECQWARELSELPQCSRPYRGFGSSDCGCFSHLIYCPAKQALADVRQSFGTSCGWQILRLEEVGDLPDGKPTQR